MLVETDKFTCGLILIVAVSLLVARYETIWLRQQRHSKKQQQQKEASQILVLIDSTRSEHAKQRHMCTVYVRYVWT